MTSPWDSHCHIWERWPYSPAVPDPTSRGTVEQLLKGDGRQRSPTRIDSMRLDRR